MANLINILTELQSQELQIGVIRLFDNGDGEWDLDNLVDELRGDSPEHSSFSAQNPARISWQDESNFRIVDINADDTDGQLIYSGEVTPTTADLQA